MVRGLIGRVFVLALGIFVVLFMAPAPNSSRTENTARKAALSGMLAGPPRQPDGAGETAPRPQAMARGAPPANASPSIRKVVFTAREPISPALGARDAPPEYLARLQAVGDGDRAGGETGPVFSVTARAVNLRAGPTTGSRILGRLTRGQSAELIRDVGNGWAEIRALHSGEVGFMALRFLAPAGG